MAEARRNLIRIRRMDNKHLANAIAMMERNAPRYALRIAMSAGHFAEQHSDTMAADAAFEEMDTLLDLATGSGDEAAEELWPKYRELIAERERRNGVVG